MVRAFILENQWIELFIAQKSGHSGPRFFVQENAVGFPLKLKTDFSYFIAEGFAPNHREI